MIIQQASAFLRAHATWSNLHEMAFFRWVGCSRFVFQELALDADGVLRVS